MHRTSFVAGSCLWLVACARPAPPPAPSRAASSSAARDARLQAAVDALDRRADDRKLDAGRKPVELLSFAGIAPGMRVAELGAGRGYTTELLARVVGPTGTVYGQNTPFLLDKFAQKPWTERLAKPVNARVVAVRSSFDEPLPADVHDLDAVLFVLFYHDTAWMQGDPDAGAALVDRARLNANVYAALKPGGLYVIVDHSARPGAGVSEVETLHRIEESVVKLEVGRAGFRLVAEGNFLRNASDARDWNTSPGAAGERRGQSDRFVLAFVKP